MRSYLLLAAFAAAIPAAGCAPEPADAAAEPVIYVMRHVDKASGADPRAADAAFHRAADCTLDTGLSVTGAARAEAVRKELAGITFAAAYSSEYCRTAYTAKLVSGLDPAESLTNPEADPEAFARWAAEAAAEAGGPILLVMHSNWIAPVFIGNEAVTAPSWAAPQCYGDVRAFAVDGGRWSYLRSYRSAVSWLEYGECEAGAD